MRPEDDPTLERIRKVRHDISAEFYHDPQRLVEYYIQLQERHRDRFVRPPQSASVDMPTA
jgi:hypothetical protein